VSRRQGPQAGAPGDGATRLPRRSPWWSLLIAGVSLVCLVLPLAVARGIVLPSFARLEEEGARRDAVRCADAIDREARHVEKVAGDWAEWDDTYRFVEERGAEYIASNLDLPSLCRASDIHLLYIINTRGEVVWGQAFDARRQAAISLKGGDRGVPDCLRPLLIGSGDARRCGVMLTDHAPLLVAARPILHSSGEGPSRGTLIMGRSLDSGVVEELSRAADVDFRLERIDDALPAGAATPPGAGTRVLGVDALEATTVVRDVLGRPALLLTAMVPRDITQRGRAAARVVAFSLLCSLAVVAASLFYVAVTRAARLERESRRLEELVEARTSELRESAERFRALTENSHDCIMRFDKELRHIYVSPAITGQTGMTPEEMVGKTHAELGFPQHLLDIWEPTMRGVFETGQPARVEFQLPSGIWLDWSVYAEFDGDEVVGLTSSARDITRRRRMEAELREREQTISTIYQTVQAGIVVVDAETQEILDANQAAADATGWTKEELVGSHCYSTICVACEVPDLCPVAHLGREITNVDTTIRRKDLPPLPVLKTVVPFQLGGRACLLESFVDIAELRRAREALEQSGAHLRVLMEHMPVGIAIADRSGRFQFLNRVFVSAFGYSIEDTPTIAAWDERTQAGLDSLFGPGDGGIDSDDSRPGRAAGAGRLAVVCADGATRYGAFRVAELGDDLIITGSDVTAQVLAEREFRNLSLVVQQSPVSVVVTSREGIVQYVNPCFTRVTGYELEEVVGQRPSILNAGLLPREHYTELWETILDGRVWEGELCNRRKDGSVFWEHAWITPVFSRTQPTRIATFIAIKEDITERRRVAQELADAKEAAEAASRSKSAFLANMSHEIRTPLNAVLGFAQLMHDDPALTGRLRDYVGRILRAGEHLLTLINDVLEMSRIEAGRVEVRPETFALHSLLEDVVSLFCTRAAEKGLALTVRYEGPPPGHITTDQGRLRQILVNLVGNAIKFTGRGSVTIRVAGAPREDVEWPLTLAVEDTGTGIAPEDVARLFRPFEQAYAAGKLGEGTGLGLAISRSFARLLGGDITVTTALGTGSTFRLTIPVRSDPDRATQHVEDARRVVGVQAGEGGTRVLVADDNALNAELLTTMLGQLGFDVRAVRDGEQALRTWREWRPDAVLMDIHMPRMDGCEATRVIRAEEPDGSTAVIAISASALSEEREAALRAGCDDFIAKPISADEALSALARHTGVHYLYGGEPSAARATHRAAEAAAAPTAESPRALPEDLVAGLARAVREARIDRVSELVEELRAHDPRAADRVQQLAAAFNYDAILALLGGDG
jgi:PAS domain S-box-containing protein